MFINDKSAKPATEVKEGDILRLEYFNKTIIAKILKVPAGNVSIQESRDLYEITDEIIKINEKE